MLMRLLSAPLLSVWLALGAILPAIAAKPVVHAVLFFSPTCPHCHRVMTEVLPPLQDEYGDQLQIAEINVAEPKGQELYNAAVDRYRIPPRRRGVPTLIVGDQVLVGDWEIPNHFPKLIAEGLSAGGIGWPDIPGFEPPAEPTTGAAATHVSIRERLAQDPGGNAMAIVVLVGMIFYVIWVGARAWQEVRRGGHLALGSPQADWLVPILAVAGLIVAAYLSYIELTRVTAVCGPIGDCNTVQESPYARLFGVLPVGLLGMAGYIAILIAWAVGRWGEGAVAAQGRLALFAFTAFGTLFSIYLTFLEPFVIGATCAWCVSSAIIMTVLLGLSWQQGVAAWAVLRRSAASKARS
ncbi:MAG: vitamin K epoxide reductase [Anaerolineae bacterium]|nr:vitamin K epoxide reductase [Anaerolineae bacterium]